MDKDIKKSKMRMIRDVRNYNEEMQNIYRWIDEDLKKVEWTFRASAKLWNAVCSYMMNFYEDSNHVTTFSKRITMKVRDIELAKRIRSRFERMFGYELVHNKN